MQAQTKPRQGGLFSRRLRSCTGDGGTSWTSARIDSSVLIADAVLKIPVAGPILFTDTNGDGWLAGGAAVALSFLSRAAGLAIFQDGICEGFKTDCASFSALFKTADAGASWHQLTP